MNNRYLLQTNLRREFDVVVVDAILISTLLVVVSSEDSSFNACFHIKKMMMTMTRVVLYVLCIFLYVFRLG